MTSRDDGCDDRPRVIALTKAHTIYGGGAVKVDPIPVAGALGSGFGRPGKRYWTSTAS